MKMVWPVYGHQPRETLAVFFDWGSAADFAMRPTDFGAEQRSLYIGEPTYDLRTTGYAGECDLVEVERLGPGRIAA